MPVDTLHLVVPDIRAENGTVHEDNAARNLGTELLDEYVGSVGEIDGPSSLAVQRAELDILLGVVASAFVDDLPLRGHTGSRRYRRTCEGDHPVATTHPTPPYRCVEPVRVCA